MAEEQNPNRMNSFILLSIFFIILMFLDAALTIFALTRGAKELNPFMERNINYIIPLKTLGSLLTILGAYFIMKKYNTQIGIKYSACVMTAVVIWNATQLYLGGKL